LLAPERRHGRVDLADLLAAVRVLRGERSRQRARPATDVHYAAGVRRPQNDPDPAQVVELQMRRIGQIDIGGVHVALAEQTPGGPPRVAFGHEIAGAGEGHWPSPDAFHAA
jgi:hypothetical protein